MPLRTLLLFAFANVAFTQTLLHPQVFSANQDFSFAESVRTTTTTKSSGTGVPFSFPPPSVSDLGGSLLQSVHVMRVNAAGLPTQFSVTYSAKPDGSNTAKDGPLGRPFVVDCEKPPLQVSVRDGKAIPANDRRFVSDNATRLLNYLAASKDLSRMNVPSDGPMDLPVGIIAKLLDIHDEIRRATIKMSSKDPTPTFDVQIVSLKPGEDDIIMAGVLQIASDWSSFAGSFKTKSSREVVLEPAKIRIDAETSLTLARTFGQP